MSLFLPTDSPLACPRCGGLGERAIPDASGRIMPWARTVICECDGTGRAACGTCGMPGNATHLEGGHPVCDGCDPVVGPVATAAPAEVVGAA